MIVDNKSFLDHLLTSEVDTQRVIGRLLATPVTDELQAFMREELARGTRQGTLVIGVTEALAIYLGAMTLESSHTKNNAIMAAKLISDRFSEYMTDFVANNDKENVS